VADATKRKWKKTLKPDTRANRQHGGANVKKGGRTHRKGKLFSRCRIIIFQNSKSFERNICMYLMDSIMGKYNVWKFKYEYL
jgi:hypothetical protein